MRRVILTAAAVVAAYALSPTKAHAQAPPPVVIGVAPAVHNVFPWYAFVCPASIVLSSVVADFKDNRQLTYWEALTCGLLYWVPMPQQPPKKHHRSHTSALIVDRPRYS